MMRRFELLFLLSGLLTHLGFSTSQLNYLHHFCSGASYANDSAFGVNVNLLLSPLTSKVIHDGYYKTTMGWIPDSVYGDFLCRGDVTIEVCRNCIIKASEEIVKRCSMQNGAVIWFDECMLHYSNINYFGVIQMALTFKNYTQSNSQQHEPEISTIQTAISELILKAQKSPMMFAAEKLEATEVGTRYGLVQCTRDLSSDDCSTCLRLLTPYIKDCCEGKPGGRLLTPSCNMRYEDYSFYQETINATPPDADTDTTNKGKAKTLRIAIITTAAILAAMLLGSCFYYLRFSKIMHRFRKIMHEDVDVIRSVESLQFDFGTLRAATENFSDANKLGQGGFGVVYKGWLPNGQAIAVKRLSTNSGQGDMEFKNEAGLLAKVQHKNLVKLLGFCLEREERLLIYEFVPNASLDQFIFDRIKRAQLGWEGCTKIIEGIARGLLYLHEDSRLRIIHRDLKASNILLDEEMKAKISDFGSARLFVVDQTQGSTSRIVGTYGYMAPEYALHGQFSVKSDVYSFGVLLLEILIGQKINCFYHLGNPENLPSYVWRKWKEGTALELLDSTFRESCSSGEVMRCIHVGLLCVQENVDARPTMASVVLMLNISYSVTLPLPSQPSFFVHSRMEYELSSRDYISKPTPLSANGASNTDLYPR